ncbi:MAG TPA: SDR family NAD(P)-dependent oxidoreductase [Candidatus Elarobacter sp.]|jgi:short-subunit dehydrogenase
MSVVVVTGASSGIGRALALRAARAGYDVVAVGRNQIALDALAERVRADGGRIVTAALDVAKPESARAVVALARREFGGIDVLVNNAGHVAVGPLAEQSDAELQDQFGTHVIGPVALVREALPLLRAARGHVFLVGSGVARVPVHGLGAYSPSKAAVRSAAAVLRRELKPDGIAVTYVDPGVVDTAFMTRAGMPGAPPSILASPETVARKILLAFRSRPRVVNAVPWQTAFVALGELFPRLTDAIVERNPSLVGIQAAQPPAAIVAEPPPPAIAAPEPEPVTGSLDAALEPVRRRMERVKLSESFVTGLLQPDAELDENEIALRWAGMPNKNERAATHEVLEALADGGFLAREGERYRVVRAP